MLAVFLNNLLLGAPHAIYHMQSLDEALSSYTIIHMFLYLHLVTGPVVFVYFNQHHRRRVLQALKFCFNHSHCGKVTPTPSSQVTQSPSALQSSVDWQGKASPEHLLSVLKGERSKENNEEEMGVVEEK